MHNYTTRQQIAEDLEEADFVSLIPEGKNFGNGSKHNLKTSEGMLQYTSFCWPYLSAPPALQTFLSLPPAQLEFLMHIISDKDHPAHS